MYGWVFYSKIISYMNSTQIIKKTHRQYFKKIFFSISKKQKKQEWNNKSRTFWETQQATNNGVLLGHENLNCIDIDFSRTFLKQLLANMHLGQLDNVLDCGAGIGRVSKQLLSNYAKTIDILEQTPKFVTIAKSNLESVNIGNFYCQSLQEFNFSCQYNCIWIQWTLTHLRQQDTIAFLNKAKKNLKLNGFVIIKQNISQNKKIVDYSDSTVIRTDNEWRRLFDNCKFKIIEESIQSPWPHDLEKVKMYALV